MAENQTNIVIARSPKSTGIALILTFFFGSLGLFYSTILGGFIMLLVELIIGVLTFGIGLIFTHIACLIWAVIAVNSYNKKLMSGQF